MLCEMMKGRNLENDLQESIGNSARNHETPEPDVYRSELGS